MIDEGGARRPNPAHDVVGRADHHHGNAGGFDDVGDDTDGLLACLCETHRQAP